MTTNPRITPDELYKFLGLDCRVHRYPDREAWKAARHGELYNRTGSSELAALFGCEHAWDSQFSLYAKRTDPDAWAEAVEREAERLYWGRRMETVILDEFAERFSARVCPWPQVDICVANDWAGFCTPDSIIVDDDGPLVGEVKSYSEYDRKRWQDGPPIEIVLQNLHQQEVTGIHRGKVIVLFGNQLSRLGVFNVDYDESFAKAIRDRAERFSHYVTTRTEPPIDESTMTAEAIFRMHLDDSGEEVELPEESAAWAMERESLKSEAKRIEDRLTHLDNQLKAALGDATFGVTPGNQWFSWKTQNRSGIDKDKLAAEFADVFAQVQKPSKCRVLLALKKPPKV